VGFRKETLRMMRRFLAIQEVYKQATGRSGGALISPGLRYRLLGSRNGQRGEA
jgi:hypothetical protein